MSKDYRPKTESSSSGSKQPNAETITERRKRVAESIGRLLARHWLRQRRKTENSTTSISNTHETRAV